MINFLEDHEPEFGVTDLHPYLFGSSRAAPEEYVDVGRGRTNDRAGGCDGREVEFNIIERRITRRLRGFARTVNRGIGRTDRVACGHGHRYTEVKTKLRRKRHYRRLTVSGERVGGIKRDRRPRQRVGTRAVARQVNEATVRQRQAVRAHRDDRVIACVCQPTNRHAARRAVGDGGTVLDIGGAFEVNRVGVDVHGNRTDDAKLNRLVNKLVLAYAGSGQVDGRTRVLEPDSVCVDHIDRIGLTVAKSADRRRAGRREVSISDLRARGQSVRQIENDRIRAEIHVNVIFRGELSALDRLEPLLALASGRQVNARPAAGRLQRDRDVIHHLNRELGAGRQTADGNVRSRTADVITNQFAVREAVRLGERYRVGKRVDRGSATCAERQDGAETPRGVSAAGQRHRNERSGCKIFAALREAQLGRADLVDPIGSAGGEPIERVVAAAEIESDPTETR